MKIHQNTKEKPGIMHLIETKKFLNWLLIQAKDSSWDKIMEKNPKEVIMKIEKGISSLQDVIDKCRTTTNILRAVEEKSIYVG